MNSVNTNPTIELISKDDNDYNQVLGFLKGISYSQSYRPYSVKELSNYLKIDMFKVWSICNNLYVSTLFKQSSIVNRRWWEYSFVYNNEDI
jgi:hypothetical protein